MRVVHFLFLVTFVLLSSCSKQNLSPSEHVGDAPKEDPKKPQAQTPPAALPKEVLEAIQTHKLYTYPEITVLLAVKDAQRTAEKIKSAGGKITYDPNLGQGSDIAFLIAEIPPEKVLDADFVKSLDLKAISVDHPLIRRIKPASGRVADPIMETAVPVADVKIPELRRRPGNSRGENVLVAVIDTGVDASHLAFQDRVVYWADLTREGRVAVAEVKAENGKIKVGEEQWDVPAAIKDEAPIYLGTFDEKAMGSQNGDADKIAGKDGFDINNNGLYDDKFALLIGSAKDDKSTLIAFVDTNGNGKLEASEAEAPVMDFNAARAFTRKAKSYLKDPPATAATPAGQALLRFPSRNSTQAYPLLFARNDEGKVGKVAIGVDQNSHGTHVSGIIAGNDERTIVGVAPKAEIMALKVCSGITCTEAAILRGLVQAFYNSQGIVPDVVNISLGSHEAYQQDPFNFLIRDLSAKFGTTFFISASNDGPGYRSLNSIGSFGPTVLVGAHVSKNTLTKHYTLNPDLDVPDHSLLFFSSPGPSYTGQLRPNIVAPGSALSSVPMMRGRSAMYNGTSMSSPLAAGSAAALLGLARTPDAAGEIKNAAVRKLEAKRATKIQAILSKEGKSEYSNIDLPLAMRTSLEDSATRMPQYTIAQRGHGLINIDAAYQRYLEVVKQVVDKDAHYFDFKINESQKGLYDRANQIARSKQITLGIENDGEASRETYDISNQTLTVKLETIEIQGTNGVVETMNVAEVDAKDLPFSVANRGVEGRKATSAEVILNDGVKNFYYSLRHPELMEAGKTYLAHYNVYRGDRRLFTLLDVVHKPIDLPNVATAIDLPALELNKTNRVAAYGVHDQRIGANSFHRYPIAVTPQDGTLKVHFGFSAQDGVATAGGFVYLAIYDPDGKPVLEDVAQRSNQLPSERRTVKMKLPTKKKVGIYEVTIAAAGSRWNGPTKYDLLVEALRFKPSVEKLELATQVSQGKMPAQRLLSFTNSGQQVTRLSPSTGSISRMVSLKPLKVVPNRWTYKKLEIPTADSTTVEVQFGPSHDPDYGFIGRIDNHLYRLKDGKTPEVVYTADKDLSKEKVVFLDVAPSESLYVAVETFHTVAESASLNKTIESIDVEAIFPDLAVRLKGELKASVKPESTKDLFLVSLDAPKAIEGVTSDKKKPAAWVRATLDIGTDNPDISAEIPVTLFQ